MTSSLLCTFYCKYLKHALILFAILPAIFGVACDGGGGGEKGPILSITSSTEDGYYKPGDSINITVNFTKEVSLDTGSLNVTLDTGDVITIPPFSNATSASAVYVVSAGDSSSDLDAVALAVNTGQLTDGTGKVLTVELPESTIADSSSIVVDGVGPAILNVTSSIPDGVYEDDSVIPVQIIFNETVLVSGTPRLTLETGDNDAVVDYSSGSGSNTLVFLYTISSAENHASGDLAYLSSTALSLNDGTILDTVGNNAILTLSPPGEPGSLSANKDILFDTIPRNVQFTEISSSSLEKAGSPGILVKLSAPAVAPVSVYFSITGTVTHTGTYRDYEAGGGTMTIDSGLISAVLPLSIINDTIDENEETAIVELTGATGAAIGTNSVHTSTIFDDDDPPTVSFEKSISETADELETIHEIKLVLSQVSEKTVQVSVTDSGGTSLSGTDYDLTVASSQTVTFSPGTVTETVSFTPIHDNDDEGSGETVILNLSAPDNATLGVLTTHTATIRDDDNIPTLVVRDSSFFESDCSDDATVDVYLAGTSSESVTVNYTTVPGTADSSDHTSVSGSLTWLPGETGIKSFQVPVSCDSISETTETVNLVISDAQNADIVDSNGILTITDDDVVFSIASAETLDCDPVDGHIDHYKITFSDDINDSTFDGYQRNSEGLPVLSWKIAGYSNVRLDHGSAFSDGSSDLENDNVVYLKFDPGYNADSGLIPEITAVASSLKSLSSGSGLYGGTGSLDTGDVTETDGARPYIRYAMATNGGGVNGSAGTGDILEIYYSEATNAADLSGIDPDTVLLVNNSHSFGSAADLTSAVWTSTIFDNDTLRLTFSSDVPTVNISDSLKATGTAVTDLAGNSPSDTADVFSPPAILGAFDEGARGPVITEAVYLDTDDNGHIDHVKVVFDKNVDESTFPGYQGDDRVNDVTEAWKVSGHSNVALDTSNSLDSDTSDNTVYLKFSEASAYDTGTKPDLTADKGVAGLRDSNDACYVNTNIANCLNEGEAVVLTTDVNEKDGAAPVITHAFVKGINMKNLFIGFSENVWSEENTPPCSSGGLLNVSDFAYQNISTDGVSDVENFNNDPCAAEDAKVEIITDTTFVAADIYKDKIGAIDAEIFDGANNGMKDSIFKVVKTAEAPYVLAASSYYDNIAGKHYLRLFYSSAVNAESALDAASYAITEDSSTPCDDLSSIPLSVTMVSNTVFDLETGNQCGEGDVNNTTYRVTVSSNVISDVTGLSIGSPDMATAAGTGSSDSNAPRLMMAESLGPDRVKLIYSEPMSIGDISGSAECRESFIAGISCSADVDDIAAGTQFKYILSPSLGTVVSVEATDDPSVYILTHSQDQTGNFYSLTVYTENADADIPEDLYGNSLGGMSEFHGNRVVFKGSGYTESLVSQSLTMDGFFMNDPFNDDGKSAFLFRYRDHIYFGPDESNSGFYRFEGDGGNPVPVYMTATGSDCPSGTETFGYGSSPATCNKDMGPNGERGLANIVSGTVTVSSSDYELLIACPESDAVYGSYITQDTDTELSWIPAPITAAGLSNARSIISAYAFGDSYYVGLASGDSSLAPIFIRQQLIDADSNGELEVSTSTDLGVRSLSNIGKGSTNPAADSSAVVGIESMIYIPVGSGPTPTNTFYIANNGGLAYSTGSPTGTGDFSTVFSQSNLTAGSGSDVTLVLPDQPEGTGKVRPGEKGVPFMVEYNGNLYMARNLAVAQTASNETVNDGAELWKCTGSCTSAGNWTLVVESVNCDYDAQVGNGSNNTAISLLVVAGDYLYLGFDNTTDGITLWRSNTEISSESDFAQVADAGLMEDARNSYIFSSVSAEKTDNWFLYLILGNEVNDMIVYALDN